MKKRFVIEGVADNCPLCLDGAEARKDKRPVFVVSSEGSYSGPICSAHLAAIIKAGEPANGQPKSEPKAPEVKPAQPVPVLATAVPEASKN